MSRLGSFFHYDSENGVPALSQVRQAELFILFLYNLFAPSAFIAFWTLQVPSRSSMHRLKCLCIGRHNLVTAVFALISAYADFEL